MIGVHCELPTKHNSDVNVRLQSQLLRVPFQYLSNTFVFQSEA